MKAPFAPLMRSTLPVLSGKVHLKKAVTQLGSGYVRNPVGTGPYEFTQWIPEQKVVLTRFAGYGKANSAYAPPPAASQIVFQEITDDGAAQTAPRGRRSRLRPGVDRLCQAADQLAQVRPGHRHAELRVGRHQRARPAAVQHQRAQGHPPGHRRAGHPGRGLRRRVAAGQRHHPAGHGAGLLAAGAGVRPRRRQGTGLHAGRRRLKGQRVAHHHRCACRPHGRPGHPAGEPRQHRPHCEHQRAGRRHLLGDPWQRRRGAKRHSSTTTT